MVRWLAAVLRSSPRLEIGGRPSADKSCERAMNGASGLRAVTRHSFGLWRQPQYRLVPCEVGVAKGVPDWQPSCLLQKAGTEAKVAP